MALQTAPAVHPPLLDAVTEETLRRNGDAADGTLFSGNQIHIVGGIVQTNLSVDLAEIEQSHQCLAL